MTIDIDRSLGLLAGTPPGCDLNGFEKDVLTAVRARRQQTVAARVVLALVPAAGLMGLGGAILPAEPVHAATVAPFGAPHALAPSSLLLGGEE